MVLFLFLLWVFYLAKQTNYSYFCSTLTRFKHRNTSSFCFTRTNKKLLHLDSSLTLSHVLQLFRLRDSRKSENTEKKLTQQSREKQTPPTNGIEPGIEDELCAGYRKASSLTNASTLLSMGFYWASAMVDVLNRVFLYLPSHLGVAAVHD